MKKILWVCNVPIPKIAKDININIPNISGWLSGFANSLENVDDIELHICFPLLGLKKMEQGVIGNIKYYAFSQPKIFGFLPAENPLKTSVLMERHLKEIIELVKPEILHIFGTEYPHSLVAAKAFNNPSKTVLHIQGLTSICWMHFNNGIPYKIQKKISISNIARGNLLKQQRKLKMRGEFEIQTINSVGHVIGRTDWDAACTSQINPNVEYHFCNESLRDVFYDGRWNINNCEKHSIFMSQAATPIKGLQFMLRALPEIIKEFPETHLYIAGNDLTRVDSVYERLKISSFALYIKSLIKKYSLENYITFTGTLTDIQMKERFLNSNVFISPSTIENSPNSLGEAMLLGVPSISSDVGGVKNMLEHNREGFIYQPDAPYMISYYIKKIFADFDLAINFGMNAKERAQITHNREMNVKTLLKIYERIST